MIYVTHTSQVFNFRNITFTKVKDEISKIKDGNLQVLTKLISNKLLKAAGETIVNSLITSSTYPLISGGAEDR